MRANETTIIRIKNKSNNPLALISPAKISEIEALAVGKATSGTMLFPGTGI
jgi:hypothetical protein